MTDIEKLKKYFKKHPDHFTDNEKKYILSYLKYYNNNKNILLPTEILQIFDACKIIPDQNNIYLGFIKLLEEMNYKEKKTLEIGEGFNPRLAIRIANNQTTGTITIYDPLISKRIKNNKKLKIKRKTFNPKINQGEYNLIISFMACKSAELAIEYAINNNIDFIIGLCDGGPHGDEDDFYCWSDEWIHATILSTNNKLKKVNRNPVSIETLNNYNSPYPVLISKTYKRKKHNNIIEFPKNIRYNK